MRATLIPLLVAVALASARPTYANLIDDIFIPPPQLPIIAVSFDDGREAAQIGIDFATRPGDLLQGQIIPILGGGESGAVIITNVLAQPIAGVRSSNFTLTDSAGISDIVTFRLLAPTDLVIQLTSDAETPLADPGNVFGSAPENGDFQFVPLPPDFPALIQGALLFVRVRSDVEGAIPEPSSLALLGAGVLVLAALRRRRFGSKPQARGP